MFERLQHEVDQYNEKFASLGGKALLQWYEANDSDQEADSDSESNKTKKKKREISDKPLILVILSPLMSRAHKEIQQASEIVFCDSTASLDRFNTSVFILSTASAASGIPLAVILTSDERETTIHKAFDLLKEVLPQWAFFGNGAATGPEVFMIDDSSAERSAITKAWPSATVLLCTFHFLQRRWTWLHDGANGIRKDDRLILIKKLKGLVYASSEDSLQSSYDQLVQMCPEAMRYPRFLQHLQLVWEKRREWAHCYRSNLPLRGNHTNNYAEAGVRILKELIFSRVKAYNLTQMLSFITEVMDMFYQKKLLSLANNRLETYMALRFQGLNAQKVAKRDIKRDENGWYMVQSQTSRGEYYSVNTNIGFCTCLRGKDGSRCLHQAAVVIHWANMG